MRKKRSDLRGCPKCGSKRIAKISGFPTCECGYVLESSGLGRETERRDAAGNFRNVGRHTPDGVARLPGADDQVRLPRPRGRPYRKELE